MRLKVREKLLIPILGIVIIGIAAIQWVSYVKSSQILEDEIFEGIRRNATASAMRLDDWVNNRTADIKNWSRNNIYLETLLGSDNAKKNANQILSYKIQDYPYYDSVDLVNDKGIVVASSTPKNIGIDVHDRAYIHSAMEGKTVISDLLITKTSKKHAIVIAVPLKNEGLTVLGVLIGVMKLDFLNEKIVTPIKIGKNGYAAVMAKDGLLIAHPDKNFEMKKNIRDTDYGRYVIEHKNGKFKYYMPEQQQWKGMCFNQAEKTGWTVIVTAPLSELMEGIIKVRNNSAIGAVILIGITVAIICFVVGKMTGIIGLAARYQREMAKGDVSRDIAKRYLRRTDEFGEMAQSFQQMVEAQRKKAASARAIADGHLDTQIEVVWEKDLLGQALKNMLENLNRLIIMVNDAGLQVASGASEVSDSSQALSQGAAEQASSLEQITSAMTQIASRTKTNAENATQASHLASDTCDLAYHGSREMEKMLKAMEDINVSSKSIAKIIKVIDEIAFQTNLLALNAAVEAARAGRHGKGFAVVAGEVRNLATRSAEAAKETEELIESSVNKVRKGTEIAGQTSDALNRIVDASSQMAKLVQDIASASNEQAQAVAQINQGLNQIEQVTQQNTASAEQTAAAAEQLTGQAEQLKQALSYFTLNRAHKDFSADISDSIANAISGDMTDENNYSGTWGDEPASSENSPVPL
jgi:methyl-accepting chemotaxis protein